MQGAWLLTSPGKPKITVMENYSFKSNTLLFFSKEVIYIFAQLKTSVNSECLLGSATFVFVLHPCPYL